MLTRTFVGVDFSSDIYQIIKKTWHYENWAKNILRPLKKKKNEQIFFIILIFDCCGLSNLCAMCECVQSPFRFRSLRSRTNDTMKQTNGEHVIQIRANGERRMAVIKQVHYWRCVINDV